MGIRRSRSTNHRQMDELAADGLDELRRNRGDEHDDIKLDEEERHEYDVAEAQARYNQSMTDMML